VDAALLRRGYRPRQFIHSNRDMFAGRLLSIAVCPAAGLAMENIDEVEALPGEGLRGDRYFARKGAFTKGDRVEPSQEVTLIEREAIESAVRKYEIELTHLESRRNLLTDGVPLNHLVDRTFRVGEVLLRGVELCEPCGYLESRTRAGVKQALVHRGGLRAQVLRGGMLRAGDAIELAESPATAAAD
jgi:MOSC domain-containing protein YiiM